jgi:hypothetical protein
LEHFCLTELQGGCSIGEPQFEITSVEAFLGCNGRVNNTQNMEHTFNIGIKRLFENIMGQITKYKSPEK